MTLNSSDALLPDDETGFRTSNDHIGPPSATSDAGTEQPSILDLTSDASAPLDRSVDSLGDNIEALPERLPKVFYTLTA